MSSSKSKSKEEVRFENKRHRKSERQKKDNIEESSEYRHKEKRSEYDKRDQRMSQDDDYRSDFNRKKKKEKHHNEKRSISGKDDKYDGHRKKSKKERYEEKLDKENDFCITNYDKKEKANYYKDDLRYESNDEDGDKDTKRKHKKKDFEDGPDRKRDNQKNKREKVKEHRSKHNKYDKHIEQSESSKKQSQESSSEENDISQNKIDTQICSSIHKIEKSNDKQNDSDNSDIYSEDLRKKLSKYKSKKKETEKDKRKNHEKQYSDRYSNETVDKTDYDRSKHDRIRSSVHQAVNKSRNNKINDDEQGNMDDMDNYNSDLRTDLSKYKSKRYENDKGRPYEKYNEEYSKKRKRDAWFEIKRSDTKNDKNTEEQRFEKQDISQSQGSFEDKFEVKATPDITDTIKDSAEPLSKRQKISNINMRTGGAYIPPAKLRMMQESIKDKGSEEYQRIAWEALKKSIVGMTNKVNSSNITEIIPELFKENIIRGRGVLARAIMQAQAASPTFTRVYAALVAIINTKFPEIGELILKRLIIQYKRGFRRNDKTICMTAARFLAHLLNQEVAHEILILEMVTHLLENPTEDSVEIAIATLKECGKKLTQLTPKGMRAITQRVRDVLHEASIDMRVRYMIEVFFAIQKDGFKDYEVIPPELDLVQEDDKYTHLINLDEAVDAQDMLNVFKFDPNYLENEEKYKSVANEILGDSSDESGNESDDESGEDEEEEENAGGSDQKILDMTETNLVCLRRKIYLTIQSSLDFEECAHKLLKLELKPGQILEMCYMILDCCAQQRTYEKFFGLLAQRFCQLNKIYVEPFTEIFDNSYKTIHRLETNKLRNVAKFFAHLLYTDAISWNALSIIKLNEDDTTSSSRIFIKILFQELCEYMGLPKLNERVKDVTLQEAFEGLFPRDHPHNTRFAINFFTSIGLGGLTDELREHLKNLPKNPAPLGLASSSSSGVSSPASSSSSSSSPTSSSSSSSSTSSSSSDSDSDSQKKDSKKKRKAPQKHKK